MAQPDWSTASIQVDPPSLETLAKTNIKNSANSFVGHINSVGTIWEGLELGWNGQTADEAADFNGRWQATMIHLFGVEGDDDQPGIINQIAQIVYGAAGNYAGAEELLRKSFQDMADGFSGSGENVTLAPNGQAVHTGPEYVDSTTPPIQIDY